MHHPPVKLLPKKESSWLFGHPWIYSRAIEKIPAVEPGTLVDVFDHCDRCIGVGYLHPKQSIAIRMLDKAGGRIDSQWFQQKLRSLQNYRNALLDKKTTAFRLCYGESDGIPGLVIDRFEDFASLQINTKGMEKLLPQILPILPDLGIQEWIVQADSVSSKLEGVSIDPSCFKCTRDHVWALENALKICIPLQHGQKTGWFCDQRDNRYVIQDLVSRQKLSSVLNLFSYTGGFGLAAFTGGAKRVVNIDQDADALNLFAAMSNNNCSDWESTSLVCNVWDYLGETEEKFDLVIVDPPAFVKEASKKARGLKGYRDLFKMSIPRVVPEGFLAIFSCSHFITDDDLQWVMRQVLSDVKRRFQTVRTLGQPFDHPVPVWFPEGKYLKGLLLKEI